MPQLPADCLYEIFENLKDYKVTLHSCLLVNRLWSKVAVRILWRNGWDYNVTHFSTLVACLPNESKEILNKNGIIISTPTSNPPMFNYASFCKVLSINRFNYMMDKLLKSQQLISLQNLDNNIFIVTQEIYKLFMNQIPCLEKLTFWEVPSITTFTIFPPEAKVCLKNLSELDCLSNSRSEFFYQLSQICHNLSVLKILFDRIISNGLADLISAQKNLKYLDISQYNDCINLSDIIPSLANLSNSLIKLHLYCERYIP